jgi:hypothetical protein
MHQFFHLIAVLTATSILFVAETAFSHPLIIGNKYPVVSRSDTDKPICYMQTVDGRTLNLSRLCEKKTSAQPQAKSQIIISDVRYNGKQMIGNVVNNANKTVYQLRVNYELLDENGNVTERGSVPTNEETLSPGQTATFQTSMPGVRNVRTTSVEWNDSE